MGKQYIVQGLLVAKRHKEFTWREGAERRLKLKKHSALHVKLKPFALNELLLHVSVSNTPILSLKG